MTFMWILHRLQVMFLKIYQLMTWKEMNWHCYLPSLLPLLSLKVTPPSAPSLAVPVPLSLCSNHGTEIWVAPLVFCIIFMSHLFVLQLCTPSAKPLYSCFVLCSCWSQPSEWYLIKIMKILFSYVCRLRTSLTPSVCWGVSSYWFHFTAQHSHFNYPLPHPSLHRCTRREGEGGRRWKRRLKRI